MYIQAWILTHQACYLGLKTEPIGTVSNQTYMFLYDQ